MVGTVNRSVISYSSRGLSTAYDAPVQRVSSVNAPYVEPDLRVRQYFLTYPQTRAKIRGAIAKSFTSVDSLLAIVAFGGNRNLEDAYDGAVDLLAECSGYLLWNTAITLLNLTQASLRYQSRSRIAEQEIFWEVLIRGIGCAYHVPAQDRLQMLGQLLAMSSAAEILTRRVVKAAMIDSLRNLADDEGVDKSEIRAYIGLFVIPSERDQYIRTYAEEALEDLA
ncbi:hypothetical protein LEP3755_35670 [Leptolyngbya sp. NIES-3755]|nr:hypothetical protein LEP3755_35670 [Leptolyngbya sp. NIES-3755]